jgi:hypothetical protein
MVTANSSSKQKSLLPVTNSPTIPTATITPIAASGNQGGSMWPSFDTASRAFDIANFAFIASLVVGVVATVTLVWMGNVKEAYLRRDVASTNERAAKLEKEAATLKLELVRTSRQVGPRMLDWETFEKRLSGKPRARVEILYDRDAPDGQIFATFIGNALERAGWPVDHPQPIPQTTKDASPLLPKNFAVGGQSWGVTVVTPLGERSALDSPDKPAGVLARALLASVPDGALTFGANKDVTPGTVRIVIGPKA